MPPKKKAQAKAATAETEEDVSCDVFYRNYKKNCQVFGCEVNRKVREQYEVDYTEEGKPISKVILKF